MKSRVALFAVVVLAASPALANFHLMKVTEVFPGTDAEPTAQFIELQMYFGGQTVLIGHGVAVYDASNTLVGKTTWESPDGNVANGTTQAHVLIATPAAETMFGFTAD